MTTTISQKVAREKLGDPEVFQGGVYVTKNGVAELYIQTAEEREREIQEQEQERQAVALLKLTLMAKKDIANNNTYTPEDVLKKLKAARQ